MRSLAEHLLDRSLDVVEYTGWATRGSDGFMPMGCLVHHTGPWSTVKGMVDLCINGRPDLKGPLCHVVLDPDGVCHLIAARTANHAGKGRWNLITGNRTVYGIEAVHSGDANQPWPGKQMAAFIRCAAALADYCGAPAAMVAGHKEFALPRGRKVDPVSVDMTWFRGRVAEHLEAWRRPPQPETGAWPVLSHPPTVIVARPQGDGYWIVASDGGVFAFGAAPALTEIGGGPVEQIVSASATPDGEGLWCLGADGGVFGLGTAEFLGRVEYGGGP